MCFTRFMPLKLDKKDKKILYELDLQPRQTTASIGKKVGLSPFGVAYRIKRMMHSGLIKGFYALIDVSKLGYSGFRVYMKLEDISPEKQLEFITYLSEQKNIFWVNTYLHGSWDIGCHIWAKNVHEFHTLWMKILTKFKQYIKEEQISQHLTMFHFRRNYLIDKKREFTSPLEIGGSLVPVAIDPLDWRILKMLSFNARKPLIELANAIHMTPMAIKYRLTKLVKHNIILGSRPMLDLSLLGYEWYKVNFYLRSLQRKQELFHYVAQNPHLVHIYDAIGLSDFEIGLEVRDVHEFYAILEDIRSKFSDSIKDYDYFIIFKEHKLLLVPEG